MISIGIDIGSKGAICVMEDKKIVKTCAFPQLEGRPDLKKFCDILLEVKQTFGKYTIGNIGSPIHCAIEDLHSIFGTGAKSNFQFGWINGATEAILTSLNIPYTKVQAKKWQKSLWEGIRPVEVLVKGKKNKDGSPKYKIDTKATSLLAAKRLFPDQTFLATERSKVPHDGIVDAILICEYCRRHFS